MTDEYLYDKLPAVDREEIDEVIRQSNLHYKAREFCPHLIFHNPLSKCKLLNNNCCYGKCPIKNGDTYNYEVI